jgi:hypothetical protein
MSFKKNLKIMRKLAYSILALIVLAGTTLTASAQSEETRDVSGFTSIGSGGPFNVHVKIDGTESLKINGPADAISQIETKVEDGNLEIRWKDKWRNNGDKHWGKIDIYVTARSLTGVALAGSGDMTVDGTVSGDNVNVALSGSGNISTAVKASDLHTSISGSGSVHLDGSADETKISVSGSGSLNAKELKTNTANVNVAGSGNVYLIAEKTISGHIAGSGNVVYSGNATEEDVRTAGSGRVSRE